MQTTPGELAPPSLRVSTYKLFINTPFTVTVSMGSKWREMNHLCAEDVWSAGLHATSHLEGVLSQAIGPCRKCTKNKSVVELAIAQGSEFQSTVGCTDRFVFNSCRTHCSSSRLHLGARVILSISLPAVGVSIYSDPLELCSKVPKRRREQSAAEGQPSKPGLRGVPVQVQGLSPDRQNSNTRECSPQSSAISSPVFSAAPYMPASFYGNSPMICAQQPCCGGLAGGSSNSSNNNDGTSPRCRAAVLSPTMQQVISAPPQLPPLHSVFGVTAAEAQKQAQAAASAQSSSSSSFVLPMTGGLPPASPVCEEILATPRPFLPSLATPQQAPPPFPASRHFSISDICNPQFQH
eukprot:m51a1_g9260 hypothetical protein (350) ;mRNA; f:63450-65171